MSSIEFDEEAKAENQPGHILYAKFQKSADTPFIISFLIKRHIVKSEAGARRLLLVVTIIVLVISIYLIRNSFNGPVFIDKVTR
ncbi:MAG: hypothetical protein WCO09_01170 [bacterium]